MPPKRSAVEDGDERTSKEQRLQKLDHRSWLLLRPDTHIGELLPAPMAMLCVDVDVPRNKEDLANGDKGENCDKVEKVPLVSVATVTISPGLVRLFIELLMNSLDNARRCRTQTYIRVTIAQSGRITIKNNGSTLPIEPFADVPEKNTVTIAFSHFLVSSNYDDEESRFGAGKNGVGGKGANVFANEFEVEVINPPLGFCQKWERNMSLEHPPIERRVSVKTPTTQVSWFPDYARLGMDRVINDGLSREELAALRGVVHAAAVCSPPKVGVWLDEVKSPIRTTEALVRALGACGVVASDTMELEGAEQPGDLCLSISIGARDVDGEGAVLAYVNSTPCSEGTHIRYMMSKVVEIVLSRARASRSKSKKSQDDPVGSVRPASLREEMIVVCTLLIRNPRFTSQQKTELATPVKEWGWTWTPSDKFITQLGRTDLVSRALQMGATAVDARLTKALKPPSKSRADVPKYGRAEKLRTGRAMLIVTEGDSALNVATIGLGVIGRRDFGVFPIRGKMLNCLTASKAQIMNNEEVRSLISILNLDPTRTYTAADRSKLDYAGLVILSDQDPDGAHIRGLLIVFLYALFPSLLDACPDFVRTFSTPLVRATVAGKTFDFFTEMGFAKWRDARRASGEAIGMVKYYKGLGALSNPISKQLFSQMDERLVRLMFSGAACSDSLSLFFSDGDGCTDRRKNVLASHDSTRQFDFNCKSATIAEYVNTDLPEFMLYNNARNLPSVIDGLKTAQRKVLYSCFRLEITKSKRGDTKVYQLVGRAAAESGYHHGDASLTATVCRMAQEYTGSNNIALLWGDGQFGSTLTHKPASSRYISAFLEPITRFLFPEADDAVLEYVHQDGKTVEPKYYCPVLPLILINGCEGIGSGWSTSVPQHNPKDVMALVRTHIDTLEANGGENEGVYEVGGIVNTSAAPSPLVPWSRGFTGTTRCETDGSFTSCGVAQKETNGNGADVGVRITQLPIGAKEGAEFVEDLKRSTAVVGDGRICAQAADVEQQTTDVWRTNIFLRSSTQRLQSVDAEVMAKVLRLERRIHVNNMHLWSSDGRLRRYSVMDIVVEHARIRLGIYDKRIAYLLARAEQDLTFAMAKRDYVLAVRNDELALAAQTKHALVKQLEDRGLPPKGNVGGELGGYAYLLNMPSHAFTTDTLESLKKNVEDLERETARLRCTTSIELWRADLVALEEALGEYDGRAQGLRPDVADA